MLRTEWAGAAVIFVVAGLASAALARALMYERIWVLLGIGYREASARWATALGLAGGAAALLWGGTVLKGLHARASAFGALAVAGALLAADFAAGPREGSVAFLNGRFLATTAAAGVVFAWSVACRRGPTTLREAERALGAPLHALAILALALATGVEAWQRLAPGGEVHAARVALVFICLAGAGAFLASGVRLGRAWMGFAGLAAVGVAGSVAGFDYGAPAAKAHVMFANARFAAMLAVIVTGLVHWHVLGGEEETPEIPVVWPLYAPAAAALVILVSAEAYVCSRATAPLAAVWGLSAATLMGVGFWRRVRALRWMAVALLGLSAIMLVAVDTEGLSLGWRIASALLAVIAVVGAAYLHRRVERRLLPVDAPREEESERVERIDVGSESGLPGRHEDG